MPRLSEEQLSTWRKPAFGNEDEKAKNTEALIRAAIDASEVLAELPISVYAKGSYKNDTNVRRDSDVDVAVEYTGMISPEYGPETDQESVRKVLGTGPYSGPFLDSSGSSDIGRFKNAVGDALVQAFGSGPVTRTNKVFTVRESSRSLAADVVPCNTYRKYFKPRSYRQGIRLIPDRSPGHRIINYPQQHYDNGVAKNAATSKRFKRVVRILKNLENKMVEEKVVDPVPSYLIECLVYNAPKDCFLDLETWRQRTRAVLLHIWEDTEELESERRWMEVNSYKYLFGEGQKWTREEAREFAAIALEAIGGS